MVELFNKRNFTCDCGTTRIASSTPCTLRIDPATGIKAPVHSQAPAGANTYNQNFRNRFCGCGEWYDAHKQEGTMFQCVGLATEQEGGCGEDWWHPECLLGVSRDWFRLQESKKDEGLLKESLGHPNLSDIDEDHPSPPDFPHEDDFEALICYKCVGANSWIKRYAGSEGFLPPLFRRSTLEVEGEATTKIEPDSIESSTTLPRSSMITPECSPGPKKRKVEDDQNHDANATSLKRPKVEPKIVDYSTSLPSHTYPHDKLLPPPCGSLSLLCAQEDYRSRFCRCSECYPLLSKHPQLLEEEEIYQPPLSEDGDNPEDPGSVGTGSLLDRGEAALSNVDRVRAIGMLSIYTLFCTELTLIIGIVEGVMVYNHLKDKVKSFLQPFAESGQAVGAEDIKAYFEKLRGDAEAIRIAGGAAVTGGDNGDRDEDSRREQSGW